MALINKLIPSQNYELIRDRIGAILSLELANQFVLDSTFPVPNTIDIERFIWYNADTEFPAVNVNFWKGEYENKTVQKVEGTYYFNIDCYADSPATDTSRGDRLANIKLQRLMGAIRAILMNPEYTTLGFVPDVIGRVEIQGIYVSNKSVITDALNETIGRIIIKLLVLENAVLSDSSNWANEITASVKINNTERGMYFDLVSHIEDNSGNFLTDGSGNNIINNKLI